MKLKKYLLIIILIIAAFLRLWKLGSIPPSLTSDEASLGYNAYSILKTGRDEYGKLFPVILKSFGDYKPGLYVYLTIPSVAILGLTEFATRLPSALSGILTVFLIYLIIKKLFPENNWLGVITTFVGATNPWLIYFSRGAWEVNVCLTLTLLGIYFFLRAREKTKFIILSLIFFSLTLITYQGAKLSTSLVLLSLIISFWKDFTKVLKDGKSIILGIIISFVISLPIILSFFNGSVGRLEVFSVFSYKRPETYLQNFLDEGKEKVGSLTYYVYHSESLNFLRGVLGRYFNHFSGRFLFFEGDWSNPRQGSPYQGVMLISDIIFLPLGLFILFRKRLDGPTLFVLLWLALACLPAALSRDQVHAVRAMNMAIPLIITVGFGYQVLIERFKKVGLFVSGLVFLIAFSYFSDSYFIHVPAHDSDLWNYGYKQIVETIVPIQGNYKRILVQQSFAQPYIYLLFYMKYDPAKYQKIAKLTPSEYSGDVGYVTKLDNIEFGPIDWSVDRGDHGTLIVGDTVRIPPQDSNDAKSFKLIREIKYLNGRDAAFKIIEVL